MVRTTMMAAALLAAWSAPVLAQSTKENFSYAAPSGMFGDGTTKWNMYRFIHEDAERTARLRAGDDLATGSIGDSAIGPNQYRQPGETDGRRRR